MRKREFEYKGKTYTIDELKEMFPQVNGDQLANRLYRNWTVEEAVAPETKEDYIPVHYRNKILVVKFRRPIPVAKEMHPILNERYIAKPHTEGNRGKVFYEISIDGKPLIVYPGEFSILGLALKCTAQECTPPYGDTEDCELYMDGYCLGFRPEGKQW